MNAPLKMLLAGAVSAALVLTGGYANTYRLESKLRDLQAACVEEGKQESLAKSFGGTLLCDPKILINTEREDSPSKGIQAQLVEVQRSVSRADGWYYFLAVGIFALLGVPWAWYFLLRRIRELRNAIAGQ